MNFAETIISKKLKEADPTLDISGSDRRMLQVAHQDFSNYLKFNNNFADQEAYNLSLAQRMEHLHREDPVELESFLTVWTGIWLKKWKKRVKLLLGKQNQSKMSKAVKTLANAESHWRKLDCKEEIMGIVISALIKNGEICGTEILAESLVKTELGKKIDLDVNSGEQVLAVLNNALRRARQMAHITGPLITLKIGKNYF